MKRERTGSEEMKGEMKEPEGNGEIERARKRERRGEKGEKEGDMKER